MEQIEKDILHVKAGALLQLGMQIGAELQLTKENDRDQVMMQLLAMQRLVQMEGYSPISPLIILVTKSVNVQHIKKQ